MALVLGGACCLWDDLEAYAGPIDGVVACNDAGAAYRGDLDAWVSVHSDHFARWTAQRAANGFAPAKRVMGFIPAPDVEYTDWKFPGGSENGTSALFAAKVALVDLGFDNVVLCGVPLIGGGHFHNRKYIMPNRECVEWRKAWAALDPKWRRRMRSMSGWTAELVGRFG